MNMKQAPGPAHRQVGIILVRYCLWFLTTAVFVVCALVARNTILLFAASAGLNARWMNLIGQVGIIILGLLIIVMIFIIEGRYARVSKQGIKRLLYSFAIVTAWQAGFLVFTWLLVWLLI